MNIGPKHQKPVSRSCPLVLRLSYAAPKEGERRQGGVSGAPPLTGAPRGQKSVDFSEVIKGASSTKKKKVHAQSTVSESSHDSAHPRSTVCNPEKNSEPVGCSWMHRDAPRWSKN